jgi:hypothetical protein
MLKNLRFILVFVLLFLLFPIFPSGQTGYITFFGPEIFIRSKGKPVIETRTFSTTGYQGPYILHLRNGDDDGKNRVSSAHLWLNGKLLFGPSDFSQQVWGYDVELNLKTQNKLEVQIASQPVSKLKIWIEGIPINIPNPHIVGSCAIPGYPFGIAVEGNYAYVASSQDDVRVVDISDPTNPYIAGFCDMPDQNGLFSDDVIISGRYGFVAAGWYQLQVMDIINPLNPHIVGSYRGPGHYYDLAISGNYAYAAASWVGLDVIDINDPTNPFRVASCSIPIGSPSDLASGIALSGNYAYLTAGYGGMYVIDISNPLNPHIVGSCDTPGFANQIAVAGDFAYIANSSTGNEGIYVIDISDPANPHIVGIGEIFGNAEDIVLLGNFALVANAHLSGVNVFDITDPLNPHDIGRCPVPGGPQDIEVRGNYAYVASHWGGVQILKIY